MDMEKTNATAPKTASGSPNVGLFVGFNLPVHQKKYQAGVCEAQGASTRRCPKLPMKHATRRNIQRNPGTDGAERRSRKTFYLYFAIASSTRSRQTLELARSDYAKSNVDYTRRSFPPGA